MTPSSVRSSLLQGFMEKLIKKYHKIYRKTSPIEICFSNTSNFTQRCLYFRSFIVNFTEFFKTTFSGVSNASISSHIASYWRKWQDPPPPVTYVIPKFSTKWIVFKSFEKPSFTLTQSTFLSFSFWILVENRAKERSK